MSTNHPIPKPQSHLINIINKTREHCPNFVLFLGAGASKSSGVKSAGDMVDEWRVQYSKMYGSDEDQTEFLKSKSWYNSGEEYSRLFEALYDHAGQRREYVESCVKDARPSWGYIYLVNLLSNQIFNTVFTTNFDDLLNEACYLFSNRTRPIVCAHDASIKYVRITSKRPKIIKLHGDFLFDNIKNTISELETLEDNTKEKFRQFSSEYGLIVMGYSGRDRSVMDTISTLLKTESNFPNGVYWCIRPDTVPNEDVLHLARFPQFKLIETEGFDEFFADLHEDLELKLQAEMSDPYRALTDRLNRLLKDTNINTSGNTHPVIDRDIRAMGLSITRWSVVKRNEARLVDDETIIAKSDALVESALPFEMLANLAEADGKFDDAINLYFRQLQASPSISVFDRAFKVAAENHMSTEVGRLLTYAREAADIIGKFPMVTFDMSFPLIQNGYFSEAEQILDLGMLLYARTLTDNRGNPIPYDMDYYKLNKLQIMAYQDKEIPTEDKIYLEELIKERKPDDPARLGAAILLQQWDLALLLLREAIQMKRLSANDIKTWPILQLLKGHVNFDNPPNDVTPQ